MRKQMRLKTWLKRLRELESYGIDELQGIKAVAPETRRLLGVLSAEMANVLSEVELSKEEPKTNLES